MTFFLPLLYTTLSVFGFLFIPALYLNTPSWNLFTYHPFLMLLFFIVGNLGAQSFQPRHIALASNVRKHYWLQVLAICLLLAGYLVIEFVKYDAGKQILSTWHGIVGTVTVLYWITQATFGSLAAYKPEWIPTLSSKDLRKRRASLSLLWGYHRLSGIMAMGLSTATLILGFYSGWMQYVMLQMDASSSHDNGDLLWWTGVGLTTVSGTLCVLLIVKK
jgi:hypothetical protein